MGKANFKRISACTLALMMLAGCGSTAQSAPEPVTTTSTGEAEGFGGVITAEVTTDESGKIVGLTLTGEKETESIGGAALPKLQEAILEKGSVDGVDGVSGATWTSDGAFAAVRNALGIEEEKEEAVASEEVSASGLKQGMAVVSTPRLGPGKDDKDVPVYSFNEVVAYVITDAEDRIVDLEVDILEIITPNHDSAEDNFIAGWPGQTYASDADGDGVTEEPLEETEDRWVEAISNFRTKRELGNAYKMNSGTWTSEMDAYEAFFKGKTAEELEEKFNTLFSDVNGRPLNGNSEREEDVTKREGLSADQLAEVDTLTGATMSLRDAHGDILGAVVKAVENAETITDAKDIAKIGLGVDVTPRLGPGKDDKDVPVYSFNVTVSGSAFDAEDQIVATTVDILEIITPNHDSAEDNFIAGWPGQTYASDADGDGVTEEPLEETEDRWVEAISNFRTKRELGNAYKMNSGTWTSEMDAYEAFFKGKTAEELEEKFNTLFSDVNGRPLNGNSEREEDVTKREGLSADQLAEVDTLTGATMSLRDAHGDILGAVEESFANAKEANIKAN